MNLCNLKKKTVVLISVLTFFCSAVMPAQAAMVSNDSLAAEIHLDSQRTRILDTLLREDVRQQLINMDVSPEDVQQRIDAMSADELATLDQQLADLPAGSGALGTVVLILIIFILLDIAGVTDIFPGV